MLTTLFLFGCNAEPAYKQTSLDERLLSEGQGVLSNDDMRLEVIKGSSYLGYVVNVSACEEEEVYCFRYDTDLIVKMNLDDTQKEFYDLMMNYQLPTGGVIENAGSEYEIVVYDNGYKFFTKNKMLYEAPSHSTDEIKPTEEQYFGIVMMWVELAGASRHTETFEEKEQAQANLKIINSMKEFAKDDLVLTWIEDCSTMLQEIVDAENPSEEMYQKAMDKLNYLGNVVQVYRYENGDL